MWFLFSLYFAIWSSIGTYLIKGLTKKVTPLPLLFLSFAYTVPFVFLILIITSNIPTTTPQFFLLTFISGILDTIAFIAIFYALRSTDISLLAPISSFTPVFTTIFASFTLHEIPSPQKWLGIILIVVGAYLLNISLVKENLWEPFKQLFSKQGVQLALLANFLWAITPIIQKQAIFQTHPQTPLYVSLWGEFFVLMLLFILSIKELMRMKEKIFHNKRVLLLDGVGSALAQLAAYTAFALAYVGYVTAVFRLSALFTIILGGTFLKETNIKEKLLGALVMIGGTLLLAI